MANRQSLKRYSLFRKLAEDPSSYFGSALLRLFPNGEKRIWISSPSGHAGFDIDASYGPYGLGLQIRRFSFGHPLSVGGNFADGNCTPAGMVDYDNLSVTQYNTDLASRQFKLWIGPARRSGIPHPSEQVLAEDLIARIEAGEDVKTVLRVTT